MTFMKRIFCLLLAVSCVLPVLQSVTPEAGAYPAAKPLPALTGNKAVDVANVATSQVGYKETSDGTVYGAWWTTQRNWGFDYTNQPWCGMFAMWCAYQAGAGEGVAYGEDGAIAGRLLTWLLTNASGDTTFTVDPRPGDFIFFGYNGNVDHVAIVTAYDKASNKVTYVGGNQSDMVTQVTKTYNGTAANGYKGIIGIGRPKYDDSVIVPSCTCSDAHAGYYVCNTTSGPLTIRSGHGTAFSSLGSIPKGAMVYVSQAQGLGKGAWAHVEYNGIKGYASMEYLLGGQQDYKMDVVYNEASGEVKEVNIQVYDYVTSANLDLTLSEQLSVTENQNSPVIHVKAQEGVSMILRIPLSANTNASNVQPVSVNADGTTTALSTYEVKNTNLIHVYIMGALDLQLTYSGTATSGPQITSQPVNASAANGKMVSATVVAAGNGLTYTWYYKDPGRSTYTKSTMTDSTYATEMMSFKNGRQMYCVVTDSTGASVKSNVITFTMDGPRITTQPVNASAANGKMVSATVVATGNGLTYTWYYKDPGRTAYTKSTMTDSTYATEMMSFKNGRLMYCVVTDSSGASVTSNVITFTMN